jgi:hypothetical protein
MAAGGRKKGRLTVNNSGCAAFDIRQARFQDGPTIARAVIQAGERPQRSRSGTPRSTSRCTCRGQPGDGVAARRSSRNSEPSRQPRTRGGAGALPHRNGPRSCFDRASSETIIAN